MFRDLITVAIGGGLGAGGRYLAGALARSLGTGGFPWATFLVNVAGCFLIGLVAGKTDNFQEGPSLFLVVGILGGFTTFSAFGYETVRLLQTGNTAGAIFNALAQVLLGLGAVWLGLLAARWL